MVMLLALLLAAPYVDEEPSLDDLVYRVTKGDTRTYDVHFVDCYDGDTCTFDVKLQERNGDYGLSVFDSTPMLHLDMTTAYLVRKNQHVRLCDINAPELHPGNPPAAVKARDDLATWVRQAKRVQLKVPQGKHGDMYDKYGRLLVWVIADGENLNERQLQRGNAKPFMVCK